MTFNRNQFMLIGVLLLLLGLQLRFVDTFVLNEASTRFLNKQGEAVEAQSSWTLPVTLSAQNPLSANRKRIRPPRWLHYALLSVGGVLMLHSVAMKKPGT